MHELSIAQNMLDIAQEIAMEQGLSRITQIHLRLGVLSGVVKESLYFAYDIVTQGTMAEASSLVIEEMPVVIFCPECHEERSLFRPIPMRCPVCQTKTADIRSGREIDIIAVEGV